MEDNKDKLLEIIKKEAQGLSDEQIDLLIDIVREVKRVDADETAPKKSFWQIADEITQKRKVKFINER